MKRIALALLLGLPALAAAQDQRALTETDAATIVAFYNRPATTRLAGPTRIAAGAEVDGDVASLGGPLVVRGTLRGDVVVINGDLELEPGGRITGSLTVVGGGFSGDSSGVDGTTVVFPDVLRFRREGDRLIALGPDEGTGLRAGRPTWFGRTEIMVAVEGSYNRVEGLPVTFGPRIELGHSNPTVLDARVVYRTRNGLRIHPDEFGHDLRLEQYVGGHRSVLVGAGLHRVIDPIERNGISDTENSLSTFILHRDYRDHYSRHGWSAFMRFFGRTRPLDGAIVYTDESHATVATEAPWSLLDNDEPWRPQPQIAGGDLRSLRGWIRWDSRNDRTDPASGWLVEAEVEQGLEGDLRYRAYDPAFPGDPEPPLVEYRAAAEFTAARLDVRRYLRMGPLTRLALRAAFAGSPDDGALPPQRQHVLGGEGTLPGYERWAFDCGARDGLPIDGFVPYYGCDRSVLFQAEYRYAFLGAGGLSLGRLLDLDFDLITTPEVVVFADAGRAWIEEESLGRRTDTGPSDFHFDAGIGLRLGRLGAYIAAPLSGEGDGLNFFVRLGHRF